MGGGLKRVGLEFAKGLESSLLIVSVVFSRSLSLLRGVLGSRLLSMALRVVVNLRG